MKRIVLAGAVLAAAAFGVIGAASAQGVVVGAGPGGVYADFRRERAERAFLLFRSVEPETCPGPAKAITAGPECP